MWPSQQNSTTWHTSVKNGIAERIYCWSEWYFPCLNQPYHSKVTGVWIYNVYFNHTWHFTVLQSQVMWRAWSDMCMMHWTLSSRHMNSLFTHKWSIFTERVTNISLPLSQIWHLWMPFFILPHIFCIHCILACHKYILQSQAKSVTCVTT